MFHQENAQRHTARNVTKKLVGRKIFFHSIFMTLLHLEETTFVTQQKGVEIDICEFFESKPKEFYIDGINKLVDKM